MISKRFIGSGMGGGVTCTDGAEKIHFSQTSLWTGSQRRLCITPLIGFPLGTTAILYLIYSILSINVIFCNFYSFHGLFFPRKPGISHPSFHEAYLVSDGASDKRENSGFPYGFEMFRKEGLGRFVISPSKPVKSHFLWYDRFIEGIGAPPFPSEKNSRAREGRLVGN